MSQSAKAVWVEIYHPVALDINPTSQSARAVWVEIRFCMLYYFCMGASQSAKAVWVEIWIVVNGGATEMSQSAKAVWVEMDNCPYCHTGYHVAVCEGCVG